MRFRAQTAGEHQLQKRITSTCVKDLWGQKFRETQQASRTNQEFKFVKKDKQQSNEKLVASQIFRTGLQTVESYKVLRRPPPPPSLRAEVPEFFPKDASWTTERKEEVIPVQFFAGRAYQDSVFNYNRLYSNSATITQVTLISTRYIAKNNNY